MGAAAFKVYAFDLTKYNQQFVWSDEKKNNLIKQISKSSGEWKHKILISNRKYKIDPPFSGSFLQWDMDQTSKLEFQGLHI